MRVDIATVSDDPPATMDAGLIDVLDAAANDAGVATHRLPSRAYHDSLFMPRACPTAMLFVPCRDGVSHRPDEFATEADMADGVRVLAHALARQGRRDFALYLQSRSSEIFQTDINPDARIGRGVFLDHATGLVVGQTAVIEDDVSILQGVTLGGTGKATGDRHPKIRRGVLIGAGAKILGNIEVGQCARVAAGSVVLKDVPRNVTVAGVPAKIVGESGCAEPARTMDQILADKGGGAA